MHLPHETENIAYLFSHNFFFQMGIKSANIATLGTEASKIQIQQFLRDQRAIFHMEFSSNAG